MSIRSISANVSRVARAQARQRKLESRGGKSRQQLDEAAVSEGEVHADPDHPMYHSKHTVARMEGKHSVASLGMAREASHVLRHTASHMDAGAHEAHAVAHNEASGQHREAALKARFAGDDKRYDYHAKLAQRHAHLAFAHSGAGHMAHWGIKPEASESAPASAAKVKPTPKGAPPEKAGAVENEIAQDDPDIAPTVRSIPDIHASDESAARAEMAIALLEDEDGREFHKARITAVHDHATLRRIHTHLKRMAAQPGLKADRKAHYGALVKHTRIHAAARGLRLSESNDSATVVDGWESVLEGIEDFTKYKDGKTLGKLHRFATAMSKAQRATTKGPAHYANLAARIQAHAKDNNITLEHQPQDDLPSPESAGDVLAQAGVTELPPAPHDESVDSEDISDIAAPEQAIAESDSNTGADAHHPMYHTGVKVKGMREPQTAASNYTGDGGRILRRVAPHLTKEDHARLALAHHAKAKEHQHAWGAAQHEAHMHTFGKKPGFADYKVSGVGRDEYSAEHKDKLRNHARMESLHSRLAHAHAAAGRFGPKHEIHRKLAESVHAGDVLAQAGVTELPPAPHDESAVDESGLKPHIIHNIEHNVHSLKKLGVSHAGAVDAVASGYERIAANPKHKEHHANMAAMAAHVRSMKESASGESVHADHAETVDEGRGQDAQYHAEQIGYHHAMEAHHFYRANRGKRGSGQPFSPEVTAEHHRLAIHHATMAAKHHIGYAKTRKDGYDPAHAHREDSGRASAPYEAGQMRAHAELAKRKDESVHADHAETVPFAPGSDVSKGDLTADDTAAKATQPEQDKPEFLKRMMDAASCKPAKPTVTEDGQGPNKVGPAGSVKVVLDTEMGDSHMPLPWLLRHYGGKTAAGGYEFPVETAQAFINKYMENGGKAHSVDAKGEKHGPNESVWPFLESVDEDGRTVFLETVEESRALMAGTRRMHGGKPMMKQADGSWKADLETAARMDADKAAHAQHEGNAKALATEAPKHGFHAGTGEGNKHYHYLPKAKGEHHERSVSIRASKNHKHGPGFEVVHHTVFKASKEDAPITATNAHHVSDLHQALHLAKMVHKHTDLRHPEATAALAHAKHPDA